MKIIIGMIGAGLLIYLIVIKPQQQYYYAHHINIQGIYLIKPIGIDNFKLVDHQGKAFTKENLKKHWSLLFFGFTHCEMICPYTINALNNVYHALEKTLMIQDLPQIVFITVDPERDTIQRLNQYIGAFNSHFIAARTTKTIMLEKQFHITATQKNAQSSTINHSSEILLINPEGRIQAYFSYPLKPEQMIKDYYSIINHQQKSVKC